MDAISKQPSHAALAMGAESPDTFRPTKYKHLLNSTHPKNIRPPVFNKDTCCLYRKTRIK